MKKISLLIAVCMLGIIMLYSQNTQLDDYLKLGLESNLALQQKQDDYSRSLKALKSAAGYFYPTLSVDARYTVAKGGRVIDLPVGDMLNPVYQSLNYLIQTGVLPSVQQFPLLPDYEYPFYRPTEQETKLTLIQPLFNTQIYYNYQVEKGKTQTARTDIDIYKRELIYEIKKAYYNYQKAIDTHKLLDETQDLLKENVRVSKSLFSNGMVTSDVIYRSEAEFDKLKVNLAEAEKAVSVAGAYFNFLLNRSLDEVIETITFDTLPVLIPSAELQSLILSGVESREELIQLSNYRNINNNYISLARSSNYPNIFLAANYGIQGEEYSFTPDDDFMLASVVFQWTLFQGLKNNATVQQAKIARHQLELKQQEVQKHIELQIINSYYDLQASAKAIEASKSQAEASEKAFRVVNEKYSNGQAQLIEFIDARTNMTVSKQNMILVWFDYKINEAAYERVTASASF